MDPLLLIFVSCMALGMLTGTLAGMLGIGGGLIIVPVLSALLTGIAGISHELAMPMAIATSLFTIIVTGFFSAKAHYSLGNIVPRVIVLSGTGIAVGAIAGAQLASMLPADILTKVFAGLVILIAAQMVFGKRTASNKAYTPAILITVGVIVGTISALMGIGGGALLVPALVWFQVPIRQAIGCAAVSGLVIALFGTGSFIHAGWNLPGLPNWSLGYVYLPAGFGIMATSIFTAGFGARLGQNMPTELLKKILAGLLVLVSIRMIIGMNQYMGETDFLVFPNIDPIIVSLGPLSVRWYGMMYLLGFIAAYLLAKKRLPNSPWNRDQLSDLLFWGFVGVIIGGRLGYVFFYQFGLFLQDPLYLFYIHTGGMSFHGGLLGVIAAMFWQARRLNASFLQVADFIAPLVPIGLGAGRIGNFLNAELWGRTTDVPWAIIFPGAGPQPRHPSQLYEFALEGVLLFIILWLYSARPRPTGAVGGLFLMGYGAFRFIVEFYREPDAHIGLYQVGLSQGQLLCIPMILGGLGLMVYAYKKKGVTTTPANKTVKSQTTHERVLSVNAPYS